MGFFNPQSAIRNPQSNGPATSSLFSWPARSRDKDPDGSSRPHLDDEAVLYLLEFLLADPFDIQNFFDLGEFSDLVSVLDDSLRHRGPHSGQCLELFLGSSVEIHLLRGRRL